MRKVQFQTGEYYHIYNRGVDKREVFIDEKDYVRFLIGMKEFNNKSTDSERDYYKRKMIKTKQEAQEEAQEETQLSLGYPRLSCVSS
ncbi:MAG: hypothetical protein Q7T79_02805, partial [bacterium]|nr:hypothetical protein [bacterium]